MNQCVPSWDIIEENPPLHLRVLASKTQSKTNNFLLHDIPTVDYEVAELTWKDGHLGMHGFGVPKLHTKTKENIYSPAPAPPPPPPAAAGSASCSWEKPLEAGDTLESLVNQATIPSLKTRVDGGAGDEQLVSWFDNRKPPPCMLPESLPVIATTCLVGSSTLMGSCSGTPTLMEEKGKEVRVVAAARLSHDWSSRVEQQQSITTSGGTTRGTGRESHQASYDTCEREVCNNNTTCFTFSTTSLGSPGNTTTSSAKDGGTKTTVDDHDSVCHSRNQGGGDKEEDKKKVTVSGKRSRCAAVHNQSERKRRDKINQRMSILQKLVPNSSKTDKASMLDEVIEYMKQLQGKVEMMNRMNMSSMMLPLALQQQQQLQMTMMPPMGMGMGIGSMNMGMGLNVMDINSMTRPGMAHPQGFYPNPYMSMASWDHPHMPHQTTSSMAMDPLSNASFLASQSQPSMTMDAYSRMAAMYQQQFQASATATATNNKAI